MTEQLRLRTGGLDWRAVEGEVIALDVSRALYLGANRSGSLLWEALSRGTTHEELVRLLIDGYSVDVSTAERDVRAFVADLRARGLLATEDH